jgi:hypothetical protein
MPAHKKYTSWHVGRVRAEYRRMRSHVKAAAAAGVSSAWAYKILRKHGDVRAAGRQTRQYTARQRSEALELYASGLSCGLVAAEMVRRQGSRAPGRQSVYTWVIEAGLLRSRARAMELRMARELRKNMDALRVEAKRLAEEKLWSVRRIALHLGVGRNTVNRVIEAEDHCDPSEAMLRRKWEAELPDVTGGAVASRG